MKDKENIETANEEKTENVTNGKKKKVWLWIIIILCVVAGIGALGDIGSTSQRNMIENMNTNQLQQTKNTISGINIDVNTVAIDQNTINETFTNIITTENGKYDGNIVNGKMQGKGTYEWNDGSKYVGDFANNKITGQGTLTIPEKGSYEGNFVNGKKSGQGTYKFANGDVYEGDWSDDKMSGKGTYTFSNGEKYVGEFKDNKFNGQGTYSKDGKEYTGTWKDNQYTK